jgi:hypothetical protein
MITFLEFKSDKKIEKSDYAKIKKSLSKNGIAIIALSTDDNKTQIKQFDEIKKAISYKPDKNIKFFWNNANNFVIVDSSKVDLLSF